MKELYRDGDWVITEESAINPRGVEKILTRIDGCSSVHIIAKTAVGKILLLREYRTFWGCYVWMLPSGKIDKESDPDIAAQRELQEETGFRADNLELYFSSDYVERLKFRTYTYIASDLHPDPLPQDAHEMIEVHEVSLDEAIENVLGSPTVHSASAYALLRYARDHSV